METKSLTGVNIRSMHIAPAIITKGWTEDLIRREYFFTDSRIIFDENYHGRKEGKKADYLLFRKPNMPITVVEAKDSNKLVSGSMQQAIERLFTCGTTDLNIAQN